MKKILAVTLTLALCISMLAVPAMAEEKTTPSICIVVAGGLGDRSFYDSANEGIEQLKADYGTEIRVIECKEDASLYESSLIDAAEVSDVIAAVGWQFWDSLPGVIEAFPTSSSCLSTMPSTVPSQTACPSCMPRTRAPSWWATLPPS